MPLVGRGHGFSERAKHSLRRKEYNDESCLRQGSGSGLGPEQKSDAQHDGEILPDASVEEVAQALEKRGIVI